MREWGAEPNCARAGEAASATRANAIKGQRAERMRRLLEVGVRPGARGSDSSRAAAAQHRASLRELAEVSSSAISGAKRRREPRVPLTFLFDPLWTAPREYGIAPPC